MLNARHAPTLWPGLLNLCGKNRLHPHPCPGLSPARAARAALVRKVIHWNNKSSFWHKTIPGPYHRAAVLAQVRTTPCQRQNQRHAMRLRPGKQTCGQRGNKEHEQGQQRPRARLSPRRANPQHSPKIPAECWQCCSLQSEKGPTPKTQDFSPEPVTLKAPTAPARHLTGRRRRGTQPCSPAFCHVPRPPSSAPLQLCSRARPRSQWAAGGRGGRGAAQPTSRRVKGDRPPFPAPGAGLEPPGGPWEQAGTAWCTALVAPSQEALSPSV